MLLLAFVAIVAARSADRALAAVAVAAAVVLGDWVVQQPRNLARLHR